MNHSSKHTEMEYLNQVWKNRIKAKDGLVKLEKDREIEDNTIKCARNLFRLKKKKTKK